MSKICKYFIKEGKCKHGDDCKFIHNKNICKYMFLYGTCKKGDECDFKHEIDGKQIEPLSRSNSSGNKQRRPKNTETFEPSHELFDMKVVVGGPGSYNRKYDNRDVVLVPGLFGQTNDLSYFNSLLDEIKNSNLESEIWKLWHGDTHLIADDHIQWKEKCPTFNKILDIIENYFNMKISATRLNLYRDSSEWKPYHFDAAGVKPEIAKVQNFTVGVSFGCERDIAFEHAKTKSTVSFPLPNGSVYAFSRDTNTIWRHGVPQLPPTPSEKKHENSRISIIAWGWVDED